MATKWESRWERLPKTNKSGGQGKSFEARARDGSGRCVFIKELAKPWIVEARKRFRREVTTYETLSHPGLPSLIEDNSDAWEDKSVHLYLVLECIEGEDLGSWIRGRGPMPAEQAAGCLTRMTEIVAYCHAEGVIHRDIKPGNVMLRACDPRDPVLVDFGLSFSEIPDELGDVTRIDEEVGNRFLRLPEAWSNRNPISDITQLAGIFFYVLTGLEPHALLDEHGDMPHRRQEGRDTLTALSLDEGQFARLMFLFDRAFDTVAANRLQSAAELGAGVDHVVSQVHDPTELQGLRARFAEVAARTDDPAAAASAERLGEFAHNAWHTVGDVADGAGLEALRQGYVYEPGNIDLALKVVTKPAVPPYVQYRFAERGSKEVALVADGEELWTGQDPEDPTLAEAVERKSRAAFLEFYEGSEDEMRGR